MGYTLIRHLSPLEDIEREIPLSDAAHARVKSSREEAKHILSGHDDRLIMIIGPCSAWSPEAVYEYANRLAPLAKELQNELLVIMRVYTQKPRTVTGWTGPFMEPVPNEMPDVETGIRQCRSLMCDILDRGLPIADELLYPQLEQYLRDCLTYGAIGARSSENQEHRILASLLDYPVGVKNPTSGDIEKGINAIRASQARHHFGVGQLGAQIHTDGNPYAHLILRGGGGRSNYDARSVAYSLEQLQRHGVQNPAIVIDASHENSFNAQGKKDHLRQPKVVEDVMMCRREHPQLCGAVKGFMVESFLVAGKQTIADPSGAVHGQSITDACMGWPETEDFLRQLAGQLRG